MSDQEAVAALAKALAVAAGSAAETLAALRADPDGSRALVAALGGGLDGPLDDHADPRYRPLMLAVWAADEAFQKAGDAGTKTWLDGYFLPELQAHGLTVARLAGEERR